MARNRQRAKDRKRRKAAENGSTEPEVEETSELDDAVAEPDAAETELAAEPEEDLDDDDTDDDEDPDVEPGDADDDGGDEPPVSVTKRGGAEPERQKKQSMFKRSGAFLRASWAELQRVQWPDRQQVGQATAVVLGFVVIAGAFLGLADVIAQEIVDLII